MLSLHVTSHDTIKLKTKLFKHFSQLWVIIPLNIVSLTNQVDHKLKYVSVMPRPQELSYNPLTLSPKQITWTKDCKCAAFNISMLKYGKRIMRRTGVREKGHRAPRKVYWLSAMLRTLLASGGTRTGPILFLPTVSRFLTW